MAERDPIDRLDEAVSRMLAGEAAPTGGPAAELLRIAAALRQAPTEQFRVRLRAELSRAARQSTEESNMTTQTMREGFHTVTLYLQVEGATRLIEFMRRAYGAEEIFRAGLPDGTIQHAQVQIGDSMLELADAGGNYPVRPATIHLYVNDADAVYRRALQSGATSLEEPVDQPYGDREAGVRDPFGNDWYIATHTAGAGHVPEGLRTLTPFLHPRGAPNFIQFLERAFGAEVVSRDESPAGAIVHATVKIGDSVIEMGEAHGPYQPMPPAIHLYVRNADATYARALEAGATSLEPPEDKPYGERAATVQDPFGNVWYVATYIGG
jgi:uncharacterized glyoxalase superfamily protein PhnB